MMSAPASHEDRAAAAAYGPWHPGLESGLPRELLPLATVFRHENVSTSVAEALELSDYCGLPPQELVAFRPERLIIHELLVRVTAGLAVPDGNDYEDLGRNFREIASTILAKDIAPHLDDLKHVFEEVRSELRSSSRRNCQICFRSGSSRQPMPIKRAGRAGHSVSQHKSDSPDPGRRPNSVNDGPFLNGRTRRRRRTAGWINRA